MHRCALVVGVLLYCLCATPAGASLLSDDIPAEYPGWSGAEVPMNVAQNIIIAATQEFYSMKGQWPQNWAEVRQAGIVQVDLYGPHDELVDPDDHSVDFLWDTIYLYNHDTEQPSLSYTFDTDESSNTEYKLQVPCMQMEEIVNNYDDVIIQTLQQTNLSTADLPTAGWVLENPQAKELVCAMLLANRILDLYQLHTGERISSVEEYLSSGWNTLDGESVNPLTGQPLLFDGSPLNLSWEDNGDYFTLVNSEGLVCLDII